MAKITRLTDPPPEPKAGLSCSGILWAFVWATGIPFAGLWVWASLSTDPPKKAEPTREEIWTARNTYRACLIYHEGKGFLKAGLSCTHLQPEGADPQKVWEVRHTDRENRIGYSN